MDLCSDFDGYVAKIEISILDLKEEEMVVIRYDHEKKFTIDSQFKKEDVLL